jgi:hypothetical protein
MDQKQMAWMATSEITTEMFNALTRDQLSWLTRDQLRGLTRDQLRGLTGDQLRGLTGDQLSWLTRDQLRGLTGDQLSWLTRDQLRGLTRDQLRGLTGDQLSSLDEIPIVENLYSQILEGIEKEQRRLDQGDFGPSSDPGDELCETPMCIAGHTVNLAGQAGYDLVNNLGFPIVATLIHRRSRPDAPLPRYDSYPNEWALAYIKERAAEEAVKTS